MKVVYVLTTTVGNEVKACDVFEDERSAVLEWEEAYYQTLENVPGEGYDTIGEVIENRETAPEWFVHLEWNEGASTEDFESD